MTQHLRDSGSVPVPDPTALTTDAVSLAKIEVEKLFDVKLEVVNQKLEVIGEKFTGVKTEFSMRDIALAAAFKAAEAQVKQQNESNTLAIDKAGEGFTKQIDSLDEKIDDLKERIAGLAEKNWAAVGAYIVGAVGVVALIAAIAAALIRH